MAELAAGALYTPPRRRFDMRDFSRVATWGLLALGALTLAVYAAASEIGEDRLILAVAGIRGVQPPERLAAKTVDPYARKLAETVNELSADRNRLQARVETLERSVGDVTASIARTAAAVPPAVPTLPAPAPILAAPETIPLPNPPPTTLPESPAPRAAAPAQAAPEEPARAEFGIDLGRANTVEGLRQLWNTTKNRHGGALEGLRPVLAVREVARSGGVELRLVAGPLPNAAVAARLCASLPGVTCHPTVFDGQRLALR